MGFHGPFLLCLGFYVVLALQKFYQLPAPRLEVEPSYPVPLGAALLLRCRGAYDAFSYRFYQEALQEALSLEDSWWESATPHLRHPRVTAALAGRYRCHYDFHDFWSPLSLPRDVPVADLYEKPFLWATPGLSVPPGAASPSTVTPAWAWTSSSCTTARRSTGSRPSRPRVLTGMRPSSLSTTKQSK
ncbi:platelet glycoprotein VI-like [Sarcophilus harrisii]